MGSMEKPNDCCFSAKMIRTGKLRLMWWGSHPKFGDCLIYNCAGYPDFSNTRDEQDRAGQINLYRATVSKLPVIDLRFRLQISTSYTTKDDGTNEKGTKLFTLHFPEEARRETSFCAIQKAIDYLN